MRAVDSVTNETSTVQAVGGILQVQIVGGGGGGSVAWNDITDKPVVIAAGATQAEARTAIGAGTSNLIVGTAATQAMAGNKTLATIGGVVPTTGLPVANSNDRGAVKALTHVGDAADETDIVAQFNALLAEMRRQGLMDQI